MPNMDGMSASRELRLLGYAGIIIGLTGNAQDEDIQSYLDAGADDVLIKPVTYVQLEECVLNVSRKRAAAKAVSDSWKIISDEAEYEDEGAVVAYTADDV